MEKIECDLCQGSNFDLYLDGITTWEYPGKFNLVKCRDCGLIILAPRPKISEICRYYSPEKYWGSKDIRKLLLSEDWKEEREKRYGIIYKEIFRRFPKPVTLLDIGCGTGEFLTTFKERGWQVLGTEISFEAASFSEKVHGLSVKVGDLLEIDFSGKKFKVITLNHVLEHLYSPRRTLERINGLLPKDGLLVVSLPNIESLGFKIFGRDWYPLMPPRHLYHFSPKTIELFLGKTGFKILSIHHLNRQDNFYSLFESFRFKYSPEFKKTSEGGRLTPDGPRSSNFIYSYGKGIGKAVDFIFASAMITLGVYLKKGETITVYAQKS